MRATRNLFIWGLPCLAMALSGCNMALNAGADDDAAADGADNGSNSGATIRTALKIPTKAAAGRNMGTLLSDAETPDLEHLQVYILAITICKTMEVSGFAFNNPQGCIDLYRGPADPVLNPQPPTAPLFGSDPGAARA